MAGIIEGEEDLSVCAVARTGADAAQAAAREKPAVVLMAFRLPDMSGTAAAAMIRTRIPETAIVFHSADDSGTALLDAIDAGATAYLMRSAPAREIVEAVRRAGVGDVHIPQPLLVRAMADHGMVLAQKRERDPSAAQFKAHELDVLKLLAEGLDTSSISDRIGIAAHTVDWHVKHAIEKLEVESKLQAVVAAARLGLISVVNA